MIFRILSSLILLLCFHCEAQQRENLYYRMDERLVKIKSCVFEFKSTKLKCCEIDSLFLFSINKHHQIAKIYFFDNKELMNLFLNYINKKDCSYGYLSDSTICNSFKYSYSTITFTAKPYSRITIFKNKKVKTYLITSITKIW